MLSILDLIRRVPLFAALSEPQAQVIADVVVKRRYKRGETIVEHGKKSDALYIILSGRARVVIADANNADREVILATLQPGDYLGEMSLIDNEPHSASVRADVMSDVLVLSRTEFAKCMPENSSVVYAIMKGLVRRMRQANNKIESLALMDVYGRVARALLEQARPNPTTGELTLRDKISRQDLAKMVGASREMVSRVMKDLEDRGMVQELETGGVVLRNLVPGVGGA